MEQRTPLSKRTPIEQLAYRVVKELQDKCIAEHRGPVCVSMHEITLKVTSEIKTALNGFIKDRTMTWSQNMNGIPLFTIKNELE